MKSDGGRLLEETPPELAPASPEIELDHEAQHHHELDAREHHGKGHSRRHRRQRHVMSMHSVFGNAAVARAALAHGKEQVLGKPAAHKKTEDHEHEAKKGEAEHKSPGYKSKDAGEHEHHKHPAQPESKDINKPDGKDDNKQDKKKAKGATEEKKTEHAASSAKPTEGFAQTAKAPASGSSAVAKSSARSSAGAGGAPAPPAMVASSGEESVVAAMPAETEEHEDVAAPVEEAEGPSNSEEDSAVTEAAESEASASPAAIAEQSNEPGEQADDDQEEAPETSGSAEMSSSDRSAAMASFAGHSGREPGGGGESGSPIAEARAPEVPDVSKLDSVSAMDAIGDLPPAQMSAALGGVTAAASNEVGKERAHLAAHPPEMDRPSGAPDTSDKDASEREVIAPDATKSKVEVAPADSPEPVPPVPAPPPPPPPATRDAHEPEDGPGFFGAIRMLPNEDEALNETVGPAPDVQLEPDSYPGQMQEQSAKVGETVAEQQTQGHIDVVQPMGESEIYPKVPHERLRGQVHGGRGRGASKKSPAMPGIEKGGDPTKEAASILADERDGDRIRAAAAQAHGDMAQSRRDHEENVAEEHAKSRKEINGIVEQNRAEQTSERSGALRDVHNLRGEWTKGQAEVVARADKETRKTIQKAHSGIKKEKNEARRKTDEAITKGNADADAAREKAEKDAAEAKRKADEEDSGAWGWIKSKAKAAFNAIKSAIHGFFELARKLVRAAINLAKKLINDAIDFARKAIVGLIKLAGDALIAIGDVVLHDFPGLRDRFRNGIRSRVARAEKYVNKLADRLKKDVNRALDALGKALDAALGFLEKALMAAVDVVANVVDAAISAAQAIVEALEAFAVLVRDVSLNPIQWIKNLGSGIVDGIKNHLWAALKEAIQKWFNDKLEEVLGLGMAMWNLLAKGGLKISEIGQMAWEALKEAIPSALLQILVEKLVQMLVPAAGAIMAIVEGLQAAWGTIKRILAAFQKFITFLKAVKDGSAGRPFAEMVAAAAIAVIDFVANWLLKKLKGAGAKVADKLRAIGQRILKGVKKVATRAGGALRKAGAKIKAKVKKFTDRFRKKKTGDHKKHEKQKKHKKTPQERLDHAVSAIQPKLQTLLSKGTSKFYLRLKLTYWKLRYGLSSLNLEENGEIVAVVNPKKVAGVGKVLPKAELGDALLGVFAEAETELFKKLEVEAARKKLRSETGGPELSRLQQQAKLRPNKLKEGQRIEIEDGVKLAVMQTGHLGRVEVKMGRLSSYTRDARVAARQAQAVRTLGSRSRRLARQ